MNAVYKIMSVWFMDINKWILYILYFRYKCPACPEAFGSELSLDHHMFESHPGQEVVCELCNFPCPNYNYLKLHRTMFHFNTTSASNSTRYVYKNHFINKIITNFGHNLWHYQLFSEKRTYRISLFLFRIYIQVKSLKSILYKKILKILLTQKICRNCPC